MADSPSLPPPSRRRRWLRRLTVGTVLLALLVWFAPHIVARTGFRQLVLGRVFADLRGTVRAESASLSWLSTIELRNVTVTDPEGRVSLQAERMVSSKSLLALLTDRSDLGEFTIERPVLDVVCEPGSTNVERAIAGYLVEDPGPPPPERTALGVRVIEGRVILREAGSGGEQTLAPVELRLTVPRARSEPTRLDLTAGTANQGTLRSDFVFGSEGETTLSATRFELATLGPLLRRFAAGTSVRGELTAERISLQWGTGTEGEQLQIQGGGQVQGLELAGPGWGDGPVRMGTTALNVQATLTDRRLIIAQSQLTTEAGTASFTGELDRVDGLARLASQPGLTLAADVDLARVATVAPRLVRLRDGTELREGRVSVHLASRAGPNSTEWEGRVRTTALHGTQGGRPITWDRPLRVEFAGRLRTDGLPVFDKLECQSDFIGLAARGAPEHFVAAANLDLDRLTARLGQFVDWGGLRLEGTAAVVVQSTPRPEGGFATNASVQLLRFAFLEPSGTGFREAELALAASAAWRVGAGGAIRLESGTLSGQAAGDALVLTLLEPIADARTPGPVRLSARLTGDLTRWQARLGDWIGIPPAWQFGGSGTAFGHFTLSATGIESDRITADITNARFRGAGIVLDERTLTAEGKLHWESGSDIVVLREFRASCETVGLSTDRLEVKPAIGGGYGLAGTAAVTANVERVQRALQLQGSGTGEDTLTGQARGTIRFDVAARPITFSGDLLIDRFAYGPPPKPTWAEPWLKVVATGEYDEAADTLRFQSVKLEREGVAAEGSGSVRQVTTTTAVELGGTLDYDLAKLEPEWKPYLGQGGQVVGQGRRPFTLTGRLVEGPSGTAAVAWQLVRAYGFDVGPAELRATVDRGLVKMNPIEATFGGGKVRLEPTVNLKSRDTDLSLARGRIVDRAKLTPAACADALGYALPAIANVAQADGLVSLDLDENVISLSDPTRARVRGQLTVHSATVSPGPVLAEIVTLLGSKPPTLTLASEQRVPVRLENGRVHHEGFRISLGQSVVQTSGSVGLDGGLTMIVEVPVPPRALERIKVPAVRDALGKQRLRVPVGGTLHRPKLDHAGFEAAVEDLVRAALKDAARFTAEDLLKRGEERLREELQKKLGPKPPPPKK